MIPCRSWPGISSANDRIKSDAPQPHEAVRHARHPRLWMIRCYAHRNDAQRRSRPATNSLNRVRSGDGPRPTISFTSPKLTRKPPLPGPLPRPPYVTTTRNREAPKVIQAYSILVDGTQPSPPSGHRASLGSVRRRARVADAPHCAGV